MNFDKNKQDSFTFIHTGDLHLDSPFRGMSDINNELSKKLVESTFKAYNKIIDTCIKRNVDFLLIAGDVYDSSDKSISAQLRFIKGLKRLSDAGIQSYIVHGNHDPLNGWSAMLDWPENVHIMSGDEIETILFEKDGNVVASIIGTSYATAHIKTNLAQKYPKNERNEAFTIGLLHCTVGSGTGHDPYAPCTMNDLKDLNYDYWALGHIHMPSVINENNPAIVYSGNPQGRHVGELGPRGCYLVTVDSKNQHSMEFIETDSIRWFIKDIPIEDMETEADLLQSIQECTDAINDEADGRSVICRYILTGRGALHRSFMREGMLDDILQLLREELTFNSQFVWIERLVNDTRLPINRDVLQGRNDFVGDIVNIVDEIYKDENTLMDLKTSLKPLFASPNGRKILKEIEYPELRELIQRAESLLLDQLMIEEKHENQ